MLVTGEAHNTGVQARKKTKAVRFLGHLPRETMNLSRGVHRSITADLFPMGALKIVHLLEEMTQHAPFPKYAQYSRPAVRCAKG